MRPAPWLGLLLVATVFAGCFGGDDGAPPGGDGPAPVYEGGLLVTEHRTSRADILARAASGALSSFEVQTNTSVTVAAPQNVFRLHDGRFEVATGIVVPDNGEFHLLVPPGMLNLTLTVDGEAVTIPTPDTGRHFFEGENVLAWYHVLRADFPNRCAGCPNYAKSQQYFANLLKGFGYTNVEVDPYGSNPVHPQFANVVAYKYARTDASHEFWLGVGGHYDVVTNTREGAFDNTAGTLGTLELARALAAVKTKHNLVFGLWGGEESGLQGSAFFTKTNPSIATKMRTYVNLDVIGFSWPGPKPATRDGTTPNCAQPAPRSATANLYCPDPVMVSAGPDGPMAEQLLRNARAVQRATMVGYPDAYFLYEGVAQGQAQGYARVNAQSDHTAFIAAGVPSYFLFNANALKTPVGIHNPRDTIDNWTKYALRNYPVDLAAPLTPGELEEAEAIVARSFETYLWMTFYLWLGYELNLPQPQAA